MPNTDITTERECADILNDVIADCARDGWTISAVTSRRAIAQRKASLGGPLISFVYVALSVLTGGFFLIFLAIMFTTRGTETVIINIDEQGEFHLS